MLTIKNEFTIQTLNHFFDYENPETSTITLEEVANALSNICRWGGHITRFFSVGQHVCLVADLVHDKTGDALCSLYALHHDDHESVRGDIPTPRKRYLRKHNMYFPAEEVQQDKFMYELAGLDYPMPDYIRDVVKYADAKALMTERKYLKPKANWGYRGLPALPEEVFEEYLRNKDWKKEYLKRHEEWKERL
jgi:5'-deoxynucleotidase YfbR-like HD superfamily hydrolase